MKHLKYQGTDGKRFWLERRSRWVVVALCLAALVWGGVQLLTGRHDEQQPVEVGSVEKVEPTIDDPVIAFLVPLTGPFREDGRMLQMGAKLAWEDLQKRGVKGRLKFVDAQGDKDTVEGLASLAVQDLDTLAVVGMLPEADLTGIIPFFEEYHLPLLIPNGSHQNYSYHDWVFPLLGSDLKEGAFAAQAANRIGAGKITAVARLPGAYGDLLEKGFAEEAKRESLTFKTFDAHDDRSTMPKIVGSVLGAHVDLLYLAGPPQWGAELVAALKAASYSGKIMVPRSYGLISPDDLFGKWLKDLLIVRAVSTDDELDQRMQVFRERFQDRYLMNPTRLAVLGYDTLTWVGQCMAEAPVNRSLLRARLLAAKGMDKAFKGLGGDYYFGADGQLEHSLLLTVFRDGKFVPYHYGDTTRKSG